MEGGGGGAGSKAMGIFVVGPNGRTLEYDVDSSDSIYHVKMKIEDRLGVSAHMQRLCFSTHELDDEYTLSRYNIKTGDTVFLGLKLRGGNELDRVHERAKKRCRMKKAGAQGGGEGAAAGEWKNFFSVLDEQRDDDEREDGEEVEGQGEEVEGQGEEAEGQGEEYYSGSLFGISVFLLFAVIIASWLGHVEGAISGIGKETARVSEETPKAGLDVMKLDLASLASVRQCADDFKSRKLPLNVLMNDAGYMSGKFELSADGLEEVFATNQIGTFLLLGTSKTTAVETGEEGRVVNVASEDFFGRRAEELVWGWREKGDDGRERAGGAVLEGKCRFCLGTLRP